MSPWTFLGPDGSPRTTISSTLDDLSNVVIGATPSDNDLVAYDTATAKFINQTAAAAGLAAAGHTHVRQEHIMVAGVLTAAGGTLRLYNATGSTRTISKVFISVGTAPTDASLIVDVHKDGTTIFTNQAHRPTILTTAFTGVTTDIDVATWADGSYLTVDVDQVGSSVAGADLTVHIVYSQ